MVIQATRLATALFGTLLLVLVLAANALGKVGVTSASDGDPLGKPPNENERILRIGIDVQADELVTTGVNDRAHLVFLDGSSLTVGPGSRLTIDKFVFDPNTNTGDLVINASRGVMRLVGGRISKTKPITIATPSSTIGIRGGITILSITESQTVADFVFGKSMTVSAKGQTQTATRAGSQIVTSAGGVPGVPGLLKQGGLMLPFNQLEGATANDRRGADQMAQSSGFSAQNSGQAANVAGLNGQSSVTSNALTNAISNATLETQPTNTTRQMSSGRTVSTDTGPASVPVAPPSVPPGPPPPNNPPPPPSSGPARTSQTLTGYAAGLVERQAGAGSFAPTGVYALPKPGEVSITTDASTGQAKGTLVIRGLDGSYHPSKATLQLGGTGGLGATNSVFTDDKTYVIVTQHNDPSRLSTFRKYGMTGAANDTTVLASANAAQISLQNAGVCACEFLTWGWWASSVPDPRHPGTTYVAAGPYVAGTPTTPIQMPQTGNATYNGFMAGVVNDGSRTYGGGGTYQNVWDFRLRSGTVNATFDGRGYAGNLQATPGSNGQTFAGNVLGGNRSGRMEGAFFSSPADPAAYQAGTFSIGNGHSSYKASGIFAGQR